MSFCYVLRWRSDTSPMELQPPHRQRRQLCLPEGGVVTPPIPLAATHTNTASCGQGGSDERMYFKSDPCPCHEGVQRKWIYGFINLGIKWSASRPGRFTPSESATGTYWLGLFGTRAGLDFLKTRKICGFERLCPAVTAAPRQKSLRVDRQKN